MKDSRRCQRKGGRQERPRAELSSPAHPRDTDHPEREYIRGRPVSPKHSKKHKWPRPESPVATVVSPGEPQSEPVESVPPAGNGESGKEGVVKPTQAEKKKAKRKAKTAEREEKKQSHKSVAVPEPVITSSAATLTAAKKCSSSQPAISNEKVGDEKVGGAAL